MTSEMEPSGAEPLRGCAAIREAVERIVGEARVVDMHTHLYPEAFGKLLLYGFDALVTYHYLIAEYFRATRASYESFWSRDRAGQADAIWQALFVERSPISEAARGVLTALQALGLDTTDGKPEEFRAHFRSVDVGAHIDRVFDAAGVDEVVMTNDPFDDAERPVWMDEGFTLTSRFRAALRIDPLLLDWSSSCGRLRLWGYDADALLSETALSEVRRFLDDWIYRTKALYLAVSLPPTWAYPEESPSATLLERCVLPVAQEHGIPFALMIGVQRSVNPGLRLAGDGVGRADVRAVERLCSRHPEVRFMVTMLARENQHELCVAARKFPNLLPFGCWWFLNNPSLIEEITRMRLELLGLTVVPQHSDARVLEQVIYKWKHSRALIGEVLARKYADLAATGWAVTESAIRSDVERLFSRNFLDFVQ